MKYSGIVCCLLLLLSGCGINKAAYGIMHGNDPAAVPEYLSGMTIINTTTGDKLYRVIDLEYDKHLDKIRYVRNDNGEFISGVVDFNSAKIVNGSGELVFNKLVNEWQFIDNNGKIFDIYQHKYHDIEVTKNDN